MPTLSEWLKCDGLPKEICEKYRRKHSRGLGDWVEAILKRIGIHWLVKSVSEKTGIPCGCQKRKESLNKLVPFTPAPPKPTGQTAVGIISHNYGRFLAEAIESVLNQSVLPAEIIVIDDSSMDNTAEVAAHYPVRYERTENRSVYRNRQRVAELTSAPYLIFLDADDVLHPDTIRLSEQVLNSRSEVGIVATDFELFGDATGRHVLEPRNIEHSNYIHCAAMVRRAALQSAYWPPEAPDHGHDDWFVWKRLVRLGWQVAKVDAPLKYRRHGESMLHVKKRPQFDWSCMNLETVQIVLPLSGRKEWLPRLMHWVETQAWERISVLVLDTGVDDGLRAKTRKWLAGLKCETQYVPLPPTGAVASLERRGRPDNARQVQLIMPQIYNEAIRRLTSEYVFWLEDDILPPLDAIERLARGFSPDVSCVSGVVRSRYQRDSVIAWGDESFACRRHLGGKHIAGQHLESVHGTGFGCLLVRRSDLVSAPLHAGGRTGNYDQNFAVEIRARKRKWLIDWEVLCDHAGLHARDIPKERADENQGDEFRTSGSC